MHSLRIIHADEKRHKCHFCGAVRYESKMRRLEHHETEACSQWGNNMKCWECRDKWKCESKRKFG